MDIIFSELPTMNLAMSQKGVLDKDQAKEFFATFLNRGLSSSTISPASPIFLALGCKVNDDGTVSLNIEYGQNLKIARLLSLFDWEQLDLLQTLNKPHFLRGQTMMDYMIVRQFSDDSVKACYALMMFWKLQDGYTESSYWCKDVSRHFVDLKLIEAPKDMHDYVPETISFNMDISANDLANSVDQILYYYNQQKAIEDPQYIESYQFH